MKNELLLAVDLALQGQWDAAHTLVQKLEGDATASWIHAVLHKIEGDTENSRYWYRQANKLDGADADPAAELSQIRSSLGG